jgi:hypothetical protein
LDGLLSYYRAIKLRDQSGNVVAVGTTSGNGLGWGQQAYASPANAYNSAGAFEADGFFINVRSGGTLETRMRESSSVVRTRTDPMYSKSLTAANGGAPIQCFVSTESAFTTTSDYAANELRVGWDSAASKLLFRFQPSGGGAQKTGEIVMS